MHPLLGPTTQPPRPRRRASSAALSDAGWESGLRGLGAAHTSGTPPRPLAVAGCSLASGSSETWALSNIFPVPSRGLTHPGAPPHPS